MGNCNCVTPDETEQSTQKPLKATTTNKQKIMRKDSNNNHRIDRIDTDDEKKWDNYIDKILSSKGELENPKGFKWFPKGHGHKKVRKLFEWGKKIGIGNTGVVYAAKYRGSDCAIKQIERENEWAIMLFTTEARVLRNLKHDGIIELIDIYFDQDYFYLVMERAHFDLCYVLDKKGPLSEAKAKRITKNILLAIEYMHSKNVVHRDIKPENIVFCKYNESQPKLVDFGDANKVSDDKVFEEFVGTAPYMSPERLSEKHTGWELKKSDVWAIGVLCFEMVTNEQCFNGDTTKQIFNQVTLGKWKWPKNIYASQNCKEFISWCLEHDPKDRPSCTEALNHLWFKSMKKPIVG